MMGNQSPEKQEIMVGQQSNPEPQVPSTSKGYEKPRLVTWSAEELDEAGATVSACVSYAF